jgi:plastocyanin
MFKASPRHIVTRVLFAALLTCGQWHAAASVLAAGIQITLLGADNRPVADAVATATLVGSATKPTRERRPAVMDQMNKAFVPQVLVIGAGTSVEFPNNDSVSHQVYSFSPAKKFQLSLYKGELHSPVQFDTAGLVVLGCNIHDSMVGYIYVADTPYFGKTDATGTVRMESLPRGAYRIVLWSPSIADDAGLLRRDVEVQETGMSEVSFRLKKSLRPRPEPRPRPEGWDAY